MNRREFMESVIEKGINEANKELSLLKIEPINVIEKKRLKIIFFNVFSNLLLHSSEDQEI